MEQFYDIEVILFGFMLAMIVMVFIYSLDLKKALLVTTGLFFFKVIIYGILMEYGIFSRCGGFPVILSFFVVTVILFILSGLSESN